MKMLLRCPKNKPYVERSPLNMCPDLYGAFDDQYEFEDLNGKVVAECDIEVEEIECGWGTNHINWETYEYADERYDYLTKTLEEDELCKKACLDMNKLDKYLKGKDGYAIHIKNLHIFDNPRELNEFRKGKWVEMRYGPVYWFEEEIKRAPSNMIHVVDEKGKDYVLLTVMHEPLCEILNGHQTIIIRKSILEEMKR